MRNSATKKILIVVILLAVAASLFCESLERAVLSGTTDTIAAITNRTAGKEGSVSYFKPSLAKPQNGNYEYFGALVKNNLGSAKYIMLVDKTSSTAIIHQIIYKGKTVTISSNGLPDDKDTYFEIYRWELESTLATYKTN